MNTTELVAFTREEASLSDNSAEYTSAKLIELLNLQLRQVFEPLIADSRAGYWYHTLTRTLGAGNAFVRLPPRACALEQVDITNDGVYWYPLKEALESEAQDWQREYHNAAIPQAYVVRGTSLVLVPAPLSTTAQIRVKVVVRPSKLYTPQAGGTVTAIDENTRTLTLTSLPTDGNTLAQVSGSFICDVIEPRNCYELTLLDAECTVVDPTHVQIASGNSLARIEVGDVLRVAEQTDWPQLPESFHSLLASAAAITTCRQRDLAERSGVLTSQVSSGLQRLQAYLSPRVRVQTHKPIQHAWMR